MGSHVHNRSCWGPKCGKKVHKHGPMCWSAPPMGEKAVLVCRTPVHQHTQMCRGLICRQR
jgi:hypothetical protein